MSEAIYKLPPVRAPTVPPTTPPAPTKYPLIKPPANAPAIAPITLKQHAPSIPAIVKESLTAPSALFCLQKR